MRKFADTKKIYRDEVCVYMQLFVVNMTFIIHTGEKKEEDKVVYVLHGLVGFLFLYALIIHHDVGSSDAKRSGGHPQT